MKSVITSLFLILILINPVYGQIPTNIQDIENQLKSEDSVFGVKPIIAKILEALGNFGLSQTDTSSFDEEKKEKIEKVIESGIETGNIVVDLWFHFHELIVDSIFAGSPIPFDKVLIVLISFVITTVVVVYMVWGILKRMWKVALILIGIVAVVLVAGIQLPTF